MSARLCFIDTETTSLRHDRRAWEIGLIVREPGRTDVDHHWFIDVDDLDLGNADPFSLKVGRFHERHPQFRLDREPAFAECAEEREALFLVEALTRDAHLVGAVVNFDADVLATRMRANGICPSWHYHLVCVENLAAGWLHANAGLSEVRQGLSDASERQRELAAPPWKSDDLTAALGVTAVEADRHTALGDARWARDVYDAVTGRLA